MIDSTKIAHAGTSSEVDARASYRQYAVGAVVTYDGLTYQALQSETSNPAWARNETVTLWQVAPAGTLPSARGFTPNLDIAIFLRCFDSTASL